MKTTLPFLALAGFALASSVTIADDSSTTTEALATPVQHHLGSSGHRRFHTANVFDAALGPGHRKGAAWLIRSRNHIKGRIASYVPTAGDPYTLWVIVFNNPSACAGPICGEADLANPDVKGSVFYGNGAISADNGKGNGVVNMDVDIVGGSLANDQFVLLGDGNGMRRNKGFKAQLTLIVDQHPSIMPGTDSWIGDLTTTNFPGAGPAMNNAIAVFDSCKTHSCPDSVL
ncbi:MAG: hypothetical protein KJO31_11525 [Gammaproteobacteria bacterium]|nr:hypothetical protein [Gammaproteobacteria bacterium]